MIDWRQRQADKAYKERRAPLMPNCTHEQANTAMRQRQVPPGSVWYWAIGLYGEEGSAVEPDKRTGD